MRKVQLVLPGEMENKGLWDYLVLQVRLVHLERTEIRYTFDYFFQQMHMLVLMLVVIYWHEYFFQGETGGPGQKGSKGDKGEGVSISILS